MSLAGPALLVLPAWTGGPGVTAWSPGRPSDALLVAVTCAAGAVALMLPASRARRGLDDVVEADPGAASVGGRRGTTSGVLVRHRLVLVLVLGGGLAGLVASGAAGDLMVRLVALGVVLTAATGGGLGLVRAQRRRREIDRARAHVLEVCRVLAAELAAGRPPGAALDRAAAEWPAVAPVAAVQRLGGDVPRALRRLSLLPGHADLALVAAAWQVAQAGGGGLSSSLRRLAGTIRAGQATRRVVQAELASARATARLMAGLPLLALLMGGGLGGDPLGFLVGSLPGLACLAGGLLLELIGLGWIEAIARSVADGT